MQLAVRVRVFESTKIAFEFDAPLFWSRDPSLSNEAPSGEIFPNSKLSKRLGVNMLI